MSAIIKSEVIFVGDYKKTPKIPLPCLFDPSPDSFISKYKITIRRAMYSFLDNPHYHDTISIWYNKTGEYDMFFNGRSIHCFPGTFMLMPPFAVHAMDTRSTDLEKTEIISITLLRNALFNREAPLFPLSYNTVVCGNRRLPLYLHFCGEEKDKMDELFSSALSEYQKKSNMLRTRIFKCIDEITGICRKHGDVSYTASALKAAKKRSDIVAKAADDIKLNFVMPPSINDASAKAGISSRGFTKLFKNLTNLTYHDFAIATRAMEAQKLLKYTNKSMSEIAEECGYTDNPHFTRTFIKLFGSSPLNLRREMIELANAELEDNLLAEKLHNWESHLNSETLKSHFSASLGMLDK